MDGLFPPLQAPALRELRFAVVDLETSGGHPVDTWDRTGRFRPASQVTEIGVVQMAGGIREGCFQSLVALEGALPLSIQKITGITPDLLAGAPDWETVALKVLPFLDGRIWVAHHAPFDGAFLKNLLPESVWRRHRLLCTLKLSRALVPEAPRRGLGALVEVLGLHNARPHRALEDAEATAALLQVMLARAEAKGWTGDDLLEAGGMPWG